MKDDSLKKFNRIVAILTQLQSRRIVTAQDLASRFDVSLRTIYRDIRTLESAGVPIISEAGTGYSIMEGYRLPPIMFNKEEALSFIKSEKLMQKFTDKNIGHHYESAMIKVKSVLKNSEKDFLDTLEGQIDIRPTQKLFNSNIPNSLEIILESISNQKQVDLEYKAISDEITIRSIEPVGIFHEHNFWYILGYCMLRKDYRQFRTDRIISMQKTNTDFIKSHGNLADYKKDMFQEPKIKVRILINKNIAKYLVNSKLSYGFVSEIENEKNVEMTFMTSEIEQGFPRWYMMFADYATILEPEELKNQVTKLLKNILKHTEAKIN